jgi:hypothetical protein
MVVLVAVGTLPLASCRQASGPEQNSLASQDESDWDAQQPHQIQPDPTQKNQTQPNQPLPDLSKFNAQYQRLHIVANIIHYNRQEKDRLAEFRQAPDGKINDIIYQHAAADGINHIYVRLIDAAEHQTEDNAVVVSGTMKAMNADDEEVRYDFVATYLNQLTLRDLKSNGESLYDLSTAQFQWDIFPNGKGFGVGKKK